MNRRALLLASLGAAGCVGVAARAAPAGARVRDLRITLLDTGLGGGPGAGAGEWGFSALVEADGARILYDTGASPDLVLRNAKALKIDLSDVETVVLSHNHPDHVGGLLSLRAGLRARSPHALSRAEVGAGAFAPRFTQGPADRNALNGLRAAYEEDGGTFDVRDGPCEIAAAVWMTGPVPRRTPEHNWSAAVTVQGPDGPLPDVLVEETALFIRTAAGSVILTGCGHAGIVNIVRYVRSLTAGAPVLAIVGGLHLAEASPEIVAWTGRNLQGLGLRYLLTGHCSGLAATASLRSVLGLDIQHAALGAVGSTFSLRDGLRQPLSTL